MFEFADGLEEILVIEEKRSFIEMFCKDRLYAMPNAPRVIGKKDERGQRLVKADNELDADEIVRVLGRRLIGRLDLPTLERRLDQSTPCRYRHYTDLGAAALFLLRLPAQSLDQSAGRINGGGRHWLSYPGDLDGP